MLCGPDKALLYSEKMSFGMRLKHARKRARVTQEQLGNAPGVKVSAQAVSQWERNKTAPELEKISAIARFLDINVDELLSDEEGLESVGADWLNLDQPHERLRWARKDAKYRSAAEAAKAMHVDPKIYASHEAGEPFAHFAIQYAKFFRVNLAWLLANEGRPRGESSSPADRIYGELSEEDRARWLNFGRSLRDSVGRRK